MGEIALVAQDAAVIFGAILTRVEALIAGVRTDVGKDALEDGRRQAGELKGGLSRRREQRKLAGAGGAKLGGHFELEAAFFVLFAKGQSHDGRLEGGGQEVGEDGALW